MLERFKSFEKNRILISKLVNSRVFLGVSISTVSQFSELNHAIDKKKLRTSLNYERNLKDMILNTNLMLEIRRMNNFFGVETAISQINF